MKYAVLSDIHYHGWSLYGRTNSDGVNSRLELIMNETERAADELKKAGGSLMIIAGDIMHKRGEIDPEVLNPVRDSFERIMMMGIDIVALPGNHDLKTAETRALSSSIENFRQISIGGGTFDVKNEPCTFTLHGAEIAMVPWRNTKDQLLADIDALSKATSVANTDLFIHAGIDGVLSGVPGSGLTDTVLGKFGFRNVFAGHYHNHVSLRKGVTSIGATTHHNWGDIGTKAGFLIVDSQDGSFQHFETNAPQFVDISGLSEDAMDLVVPGNYVRFRGAAMSHQQVQELREGLSDMGALGVSIEVPRTSSVTRATTTASQGVSVPDSIKSFVKDATIASHISREAVERRALEVFNESQAVTEE